MKAKIHLELEVEVEFDHQPAEQMTRHYPGCPADIEITKIEILGCPVDVCLGDSVMFSYEDEIEQACWDEVRKYGKGGQ